MPSKASLQEFVIDLLKSRLPHYYYYHNYEHTLYVLDQVKEIGLQEKCTTEEIHLLGTAALWHDAGYINMYTGHEEEGCRLARQYLPQYGYADSETETICGMIMATKMPQSPNNKLEEIMADADLEYLGTESAGTKAGYLFKELQYIDPSLTIREWNNTQIAFLKKHQYFTRFCKENRAPKKSLYLNTLLEGSK